MNPEELLKEAVNHFSEWEMTQKLELIFVNGWGFEHWFQNELLVAFLRNGHQVSILGKMKKDADIIIDGYGLELKCWKQQFPSKRKLINAFDQHPNADGYLFLVEIIPKMIDDLKKNVSKKRNYKMKKINEKYALILIF